MCLAAALRQLFFDCGGWCAKACLAQNSIVLRMSSKWMVREMPVWQKSSIHKRLVVKSDGA